MMGLVVRYLSLLAQSQRGCLSVTDSVSLILNLVPKGQCMFLPELLAVVKLGRVFAKLVVFWSDSSKGLTQTCKTMLALHGSFGCSC